MSSRLGSSTTVPENVSGERSSHPGTPRARGLDRRLDLLVDPALLLDRHDLALGHPVRRDGDLAAADRDVPVAHQLPRLGPRGREPERENDVVQAALELLEEVRARDPLASLGARKGQPELPLEQAVDALDLLFLAELDSVAEQLAAPAPVLSWRIVAPFNGAFVLEAAVPFQEQLHPFSPAEPADRCGVSSHCLLPPGPSLFSVLLPGRVL